MNKDVFIHESSYVDEPCDIGRGTKIWHFSHVMKNSSVGENCIIGQNVFVGSDVHLGDGVKIQNNVSVYAGVRCEDDVFLGPSCVFTNVINPRSAVERKDEFLETVVKKGATVGANATIICGNNIGEYAMIGAGAVIVDDVAAYSVVAGNPAKRIGWICECGCRLELREGRWECDGCGSSYMHESGILKKL